MAVSEALGWGMCVPPICFQGQEASVCLKARLSCVTYSSGLKCRASYGLGETTQLLWEVLEEGRKLCIPRFPCPQ